MPKFYRSTIMIEVITPGKPKPHRANLIQSPGPLPSLFDYGESNSIDAYVTKIKVEKSEVMSKEELKEKFELNDEELKEVLKGE